MTRTHIHQYQPNIGLRVHWRGETTRGTITAVVVGRGGWPEYRVEWEAGAPEWWSQEVSCATRSLVIDR